MRERESIKASKIRSFLITFRFYPVRQLYSRKRRFGRIMLRSEAVRLMLECELK